jgi:hypothetical protein
MLLHGEERQVCLQMDEQIGREVLLRTAVKFPLLHVGSLGHSKFAAVNHPKTDTSDRWVLPI